MKGKTKISFADRCILKATTSGICGSDLHMYDGRTELKQEDRVKIPYCTVDGIFWSLGRLLRGFLNKHAVSNSSGVFGDDGRF